jgi:hypothetical protein
MEALQRDTTARQTSFALALSTLQNGFERDHTAIESVLSEVRREIASLQSVCNSVKRTEGEMSELSAEFRSISSSLTISQNTLQSEQTELMIVSHV